MDSLMVSQRVEMKAAEVKRMEFTGSLNQLGTLASVN